MKNNNIVKPLAPSRPIFRRSLLLDLLFVVFLFLIGLAVPVAVSKFGLLAFLAVMGGIIFLSIVVAPEFGMVAFIWITYTQFSDIGIVYYNLPSIAQVLAAVLTLVILIRITFYSEQPFGWMRVAPILVVFVINLLISTLHAINYTVAKDELISNGKRILGALIVIYFVRDYLNFRRAIWALIIAGIFMASISVFQEVTGTFGNKYGGFGKWLIAEDNNTIKRHRLTGPYDDPNAYAQVLVFLVPLALDRFLNEKKNILRTLAMWCFLVCVFATFFTFSRGNGLLNLLFSVGIYLIFRKMDLIPILITAALGLVLMQYLPATYTARISTLTQILSFNQNQITDQSFRSRLNENTAALHMFLRDPLLGVGLGNFRSQYPNYAPQSGFNASSGTVAAPSLYAEIISEQGLLGTTIFMIFVYIVFKDLFVARQRLERRGQLDLASLVSALFAALSGYMFTGLFKQSAYDNVFWVVMGIAIGISQVVHLDYRAEEEQEFNPLSIGFAK